MQQRIRKTCLLTHEEKHCPADLPEALQEVLALPHSEGAGLHTGGGSLPSLAFLRAQISNRSSVPLTDKAGAHSTSGREGQRPVREHLHDSHDLLVHAHTDRGKGIKKPGLGTTQTLSSKSNDLVLSEAKG